MRTRLEKVDGDWIASYRDKEGIEHQVVRNRRKEDLIHTLVRIIAEYDALGRLDA